MTKVLETLHLDSPDSLKRFIVAGLGALVVLLHLLLAKYGIPAPDDAALAVFGGIVATYLLQSGAKSIAEANAAGKVAAAKVDSVAKADAVIAAAIVQSQEAAPTPPEPGRGQ